MDEGRPRRGEHTQRRKDYSQRINEERSVEVLHDDAATSAREAQRLHQHHEIVAEEEDSGALLSDVRPGSHRDADVGRPALGGPLGEGRLFGELRVVLNIEEMEPFAGAFPPSAILLKDYILDKKVLDQRGGELEVVYDIGLTLTGNKLLVVDVDLSKAALLRRMRLAWLLKLLAKPSSSQGNRDRVPWRYVAPLPVDLADILEELAQEPRMAIFGALDTARASDTLEALDPKVQRDVVASLDKETVARLINEMSPAQAADLLAVLPWWDVKALMHLLGDRERKAKLTAILEKQDEEAVHFSTSRFLKFDRRRQSLRSKPRFPRLRRER